MNCCVFAGTFDPITIGHEEIIKQCQKKYGKVIVVVGENPNKTHLFSEEDRLKLCQLTFSNFKDIQVVAYSSVKDRYTEFLIKEGANVYVRGIRDQKDLELENQMQKVNAKLYPFIKTEYVYSTDSLLGVSSSLVRNLILERKEYLNYIPLNAREEISKMNDSLKNK